MALPRNAGIARGVKEFGGQAFGWNDLARLRLEWAPGVGQFQAADLTGLRGCSSSKRLGLR